MGEMHRATEICPGCLNYSFEGRRHSYCFRKTPIEQKISLWKYEGVVRRALLSLKYKFVSDLGDELGKIVIDELRVRRYEFFDHILVPIPLSTSRGRWRGFNQAQLISEKVAVEFKLGTFNNLLLRENTKEPQVHLNREERVRNISGVFAVNQTIAHRLLTTGNTKVVIADDVWTTGSTITEAARTLKSVGIRNISALTVCG
jgi:ComF family protein